MTEQAEKPTYPAEPSIEEVFAFAHAVDSALVMLDVLARKPVQGEGMHKVIGYHAYQALRHVGWLNSSGEFRRNDQRMVGIFIPDSWRKVYVVEEPRVG